ncbi:M20 family metallopeptidase [Kitasatospora sp. McL0602]|uniref:M20 family metallopeptidase n=1 Tax=Kitasatospora sp. McL0602 TaxID=3439530 RepID=UPI003F8B9A60
MSASARQQRRDTSVLLALAEQRLGSYLDGLAELVAIDSGSYTPDGVNRVADWTAARLAALGFRVERIAVPPAHGHRSGDVLVARRSGSLPVADGGRRILLAAHMDTVFEDGTAAERPLRVDGPRAYGPGASDDKGGLLAGLTALEVLHAAGLDGYAEVVFLATPDEEIGSPASRSVTERTARGMHYALALECARENGDLVVARKGVADYVLTVSGRAAHAGVEPDRGANAALAAAHLVVALQALNGRLDDVTVNVGVIRAGDRANIVCPAAELRVEVRSATGAGLERGRAALEEAAVHTRIPGTSVRVELLEVCQPMEDTPGARRILAHALRAGEQLGLVFGAAATGGVGDANLIAGAGVPVLDGLGPVGGADHTPQEWLDVTTVPARVALLAALIVRLGDERTG